MNSFVKRKPVSLEQEKSVCGVVKNRRSKILLLLRFVIIQDYHKIYLSSLGQLFYTYVGVH